MSINKSLTRLAILGTLLVPQFFQAQTGKGPLESVGAVVLHHPQRRAPSIDVMHMERIAIVHSKTPRFCLAGVLRLSADGLQPDPPMCRSCTSFSGMSSQFEMVVAESMACGEMEVLRRMAGSRPGASLAAKSGRDPIRPTGSTG